MRTKALICAAGVLAAGVASTMAQGNVYSLNTVGYVNVVPGGNQFVCIANPVTNTTVANTLGNLIGTNLPVNGQVLKWNYAGVKFDIFQRVAFGNGWSPAAGSTATMNPGEGVFMKSPTQITNTFVGDVLQANLYGPGPLTNHIRSGLDLMGNMVPDSGDVNAIGLGAAIPFSASPANQILKWNVGTQQYNIFTRVSFGSLWQPSVPTFSVGEGFFTKLAAAADWVRNYTVPQ